MARGTATRGVTSTPPDRLLIVDESLSKHLASQLEQRGRRAMSNERLGLARFKDEPLLRAIATLPETEPVLVTNDDGMPGEHAGLITKLGLTIATVDGKRKAGWGREEWKKEIVHRWAHVMHAQAPGTQRRYGLSKHAPWTRRRG